MLPCYVVFRIITVFQAPVSVPCAGMGAESAVCFASWHFASSQVARLRQEGTLCHGYVALTCRSHELQAVGPGAGEFCFADGGRCHPAVRQTGLQQHPLRVQKPSLLAAAVPPSGCRHVVSRGGVRTCLEC